jgi:hypothetical protein
MNSLLSLIVAMSFVCHLMACGWVVVGKLTSESGVNSWLEFDLKVCALLVVNLELKDSFLIFWAPLTHFLHFQGAIHLRGHNWSERRQTGLLDVSSSFLFDPLL